MRKKHTNVNAYTHAGSFPKEKKPLSLVSKDKNRNGFKFEQEPFERVEKNLTVRSTGE